MSETEPNPREAQPAVNDTTPDAGRPTQGHTPEPWQVSDEYSDPTIDTGNDHANPGIAIAEVFGSAGFQFLEGDEAKGYDEESWANAERIVACVNAMAGIDDPAAWLGDIAVEVHCLADTLGVSQLKDDGTLLSLIETLRDCLASAKALPASPSDVPPGSGGAPPAPSPAPAGTDTLAKAAELAGLAAHEATWLADENAHHLLPISMTRKLASALVAAEAERARLAAELAKPSPAPAPTPGAGGDVLVEMARLEKLATPGPWESGQHPANSAMNIIKPIMFGNRVGKLPACEGEHAFFRNGDDARLIAAMRNALPSLLATVTDQAAQLARLRAKLAEAAEDIEGWGAYADEYFQKKHKLAETVEDYRQAAALAATAPAATPPAGADQ